MNIAFVVALPEEVDGFNTINGIPIYFTSIGKLNSSLLINKLIYQGIDEIINIGSCGSTKHKVGEILKIGKVFQDIDVTPLFEYGVASKNSEDNFILIDDKSDVTCFSTDYFYDHNQKEKYSKYYINSINKHSIFDMECYSQAFVCNHYNVKYSSYKWVSDDGGYDNWVKNCKVGFYNFLDNFTV
jgi:nucleoside phosphorylase